MRLLYFLSGFLAATVTAFPVKNTEDEVISKHQDNRYRRGKPVPRPGEGDREGNGLLGTGIGVPKGLLGTGLLGEDLLGPPRADS